MSVLDRALEYISPTIAERREKARVRLKAWRKASAYYDAATQGRRAGSLRRSNADANAVAQKTLSRLRDSSRDMIRNNPYAARGKRAWVNNAVGHGITPNVRANGARKEQELERLVRDHLFTKNIDADGRLDYRGIQSLCFGGMFEAGEVLLRRRWRRPTDGLPLPFQVQVLDADFLDTTKSLGAVSADGSMTIQGVEFDAIGRRTAYWLFDNHPGNAFMASGVSKRIPASEIIHLYRVDRPGQVRGIPWLAPIMLRLADFADYEDAQLMRQKIAACFAVFVTSEDDPASTLTEKTNEDGSTWWQDSLEPGMVEYLQPGKKVEFADPPRVENYQEYSSVSLHSIAAGLGLSYEALTGDLSGVNFTSGRMGRLEMQRNVRTEQHLTFVPTLCDGIMRWFLDALDLTGVNTRDVTIDHIPPQVEMTDPTREVPAQIKAIRGGLETLSDTLRSRGKDPKDHFRQMREDYERLDEEGLILDTDPRKVSNSGVQQSEPQQFDDADAETG